MRTVNSSGFRKWISCLGLLLVLLLATPGFAQAPAQSDATIQTNVDSALTQASELQNQQITAATIQGTVTLSGVVKDEATKQLAGKIASGVSGVRSVQNNLTIGDPNAQADTQNSSQAEEQSGPSQTEAQTEPQAEPQTEQGQIAQGQWPTGQQQPPAPAAPAQPEASAPPPYPANAPPPRPAYTPQQGTYAPPPQGPGDYPPPPPNAQAANAQRTSGPVTVPAGTLLRVRTSEPLDTKNLQPGVSFEVTAASDIYENGVIAIPRGAVLDGQVVEAKDAGPFGGSASLQLKLTTLNLEGRVYPLASEIWSNRGPSKNGYTATNTAGGAILGALLGGAMGGGTGAAIGAVAGGATGATASAATSGPRLVLPPETLLAFHLASPVTVQPVSYEEAMRLAASAPQAQPRLRPRPVYMAPPPYYYGPAYYRYGW